MLNKLVIFGVLHLRRTLSSRVPAYPRCLGVLGAGTEEAGPRRLLRHCRPAWVLLLMCLMLSGRVHAGAQMSSVSISESGPTGATLVFRLGAYETTQFSLDGTTYTVLQASGLTVSGEEGAPALPVKTVLLAVPHGATVAVSPIVGDSDWLDGVVPSPWPKESIISDGRLPHAVAELVPNPQLYSPGATYSPSPVEVRDAGTIRGHRIAAVIFRPFRFVPGRGGIEVTRRIEAIIEFTGAERSRPAHSRKGDTHWEPVLRDLLLNYEQGVSWRRVPPARAEDRAVGADNPEFKLRVTRTAPYRLDFEDLSAAGFPSDVEVQWLRLYEKSYDPDPEVQRTVETEVPILVRDSDSDGTFGPGDSVIFYGLSYWDRFPTEFGHGARLRPHVYWLSWDESGGSRMGMTAAWGEFENPEVPRSFPETVHLQEDKELNRAPFEAEVYLFWLPALVKEEMIPFEIPSPDPEMPYGVRMMLQPSMRGNHLISLYVQNLGGGVDTVMVRESFRSESEFPGGKLPVIVDSELTRPAGFLSDGWNTLKLVGERQENSGVYPGLGAFMDWFEVGYHRRYVAWKDRITCTAGGTGRPQQVEIEDFTSDDILALDVSDRLHPLSFDLGPENIVDAGGGEFTLVIRREFSQEHRIAAAAFEGLETLGPDAIEADEPSDLRSEGTGSDYLVIVHDDLAGEVGPLVELRRAQGFKVAVARTSDVYDEFGDGHGSPKAIKNYLTYAYNNWGSAYAVLVGDANEDTESVLPSPEGAPSSPNLVPSPLIRHDGVENTPSGPQLVNTDPWYGVWLDGDTSNWIPDMFIGRLPAGNSQEAGELISKIVDYEDFSGRDEWRSRGLLISDDNFSTSTFSNRGYCESSSEAMYFEPVSDRVAAALENDASGVPGFEAPIFKIGEYLWNVPEYPKTGCYPGFTINDIQDTTRTRVTPALLDDMNMGWLFVNYQGHGHESVWTHENLFASYHDFPGLDDIPRLGNTHRPFVLFAYSCHIANFDEYNESDEGGCMAERMLLLPDAGAVAAFASTGYEYLSTAPFNEPVMNAFLLDPPVEEQDGEVYIRLGPAIAKGEAVYWNSGRNKSALQTYVLLGDPAMRVDAAPPRITATVGDTVLANGDRIESREGEDTFELHFDIRDEVAVDSTSIFLREVWHRVEGQDSTYNVPPSQYAVSREPGGRRYGADYTLRLLPASMEMIAGAVDRNGRSSTITLHAVLSASWKADGSPISPGDLVGSSVDLAVKVASPVPLAGEALSVAVNGLRENAFVRSQTDVLGKEWELSAKGYGLVDGDYALSLLVDGRVANSTNVRVDTRFRFSSIVPYPNPCKEGGTTFFYELTSEGAVDVGEVVLKIYSVSGRPVAELTDPTPGIGRGSIHWDLADSHGEVVANGVYICRAVAVNSRGKKATILGKVAVAR